MSDQVRAAFAGVMSKLSNPASKAKGAFGKYTPLDDLSDHVRPALAAAGLAVYQPLDHGDEPGTHEVVTLVTSIETGATIEVGRVAFPAKPDAMKAGGDITYYRRYSIMAACGIAGDDDIEQAPKAPVRRSKPSNDGPSVARPPSAPATAKQVTRLQTMWTGVGRDERLADWAKVLGRDVTSAKDLTIKEANMLMDERTAQ